MILSDSESNLLKQWVIKKLEDLSDADSDVLADYVVALAKSDEPESTAKANSVENLKDFLTDNTETFVDQLFQVIKTKSYDPSRAPPKPPVPTYQPPKRESTELPDLLNGTRKRSYHDWDRDDQANPGGYIPSYDAGERPMKNPRRGGRGHEQRGGMQSRNQYASPQFPPPFPGMPPLDPNNPMAAMLAMQQAFGLQFPGLPTGTGAVQRCKDYDTKGYCMAGASCPFEHGYDPMMVPSPNQEYDPNNAMISNIHPSRTGHMNFSQQERGRGGPRGRARGVNNFRGGGKRSQYSHLGPSRDPANTTIVVESIPEDKCDEESVRGFFSEFGNIESVTIESEKKLATIKYESHDAAKAAYESPKVVFDNRFVKVFWHKTEQQMNAAAGFPYQTNKKSTPDVEMQDDVQFDAAEVAKKQEEAQRKHEEAQKQREEATKQRQDLDTRLKANEEEKRKMAEMIAKKKGKPQTPQTETPVQNGVEESEQTKGLKVQLAKLEAEAKSLGLNPDEVTNGTSNGTPYRGRGGFRGRPRGRGYNSGFRGGWNASRGGAVMRLDNRPKTVAVTFVEGSHSTHEEALRQFLLFNGLDSASVAKHPDSDTMALITFAQRFEGENFMAAPTNSELLHIGKVELSWYKPGDKVSADNGTHEMGTAMDETETTVQQPAQALETEAYGMTEDEDLDHWS